MTISPNPGFPESAPKVWETSVAPGIPGQGGPLRFEEGLATDTDIPREFTIGGQQGYMAAPGRPNRNLPVFIKTAQETMSERAHVGSASWVEAPTMLNEFASEAFGDHGVTEFQEVFRSGQHMMRQNYAVVQD